MAPRRRRGGRKQLQKIQCCTLGADEPATRSFDPAQTRSGHHLFAIFCGPFDDDPGVKRRKALLSPGTAAEHHVLACDDLGFDTLQRRQQQCRQITSADVLGERTAHVRRDRRGLWQCWLHAGKSVNWVVPMPSSGISTGTPSSMR